MNSPLSYNISNLHQLTQCLSNTSNHLCIHVTDFVNDNNLSGLRVEVVHDKYGTLFACLLNASGFILKPYPNNTMPEFTITQILTELEKFGYCITYAPRENLSGEQLNYLIALQGLQFDKIRICNVSKVVNGVASYTPIVTAFNISNNPAWINIEYSPTYLEYTDALNSGSAINVSAMSEIYHFRWDWLDYVANIADILADNVEA